MKLSAQTKGELTILFCQVCLGLRFVSVKMLTEHCSANFINSIRALMGALVIWLVFRKKMTYSRSTLYRGAIMGVLMGLAMWLQTYALQFADAGKSAYLSSASVVLVPLVNCLVFRIKPGIWQTVAVAICFGGILVMTVQLPFYIAVVDGVLILAALASASTSIYSERSVRQPDTDGVALSFIQLLTMGLLWLIPTAAMGEWPAYFNGRMAWELAYSGFVAGGFCNTAAVLAYRVTSVNRSSLIVSTQPVFATLFGVLLLGEAVTWRLVVGGGLVFAATLVTIFKRKPAA